MLADRSEDLVNLAATGLDCSQLSEFGIEPNY